MRLNPEKYFLKGFINALIAKGLPAYDKKIPQDIDTPSNYALVTAVTKTPTEKSKDDWEWLIRATINIVKINDRGFAGTTSLADNEQICINVAEFGFTMDNFSLKDCRFFDSVPLDIEDKTISIERKAIIYEFWVQENLMVT